LIIRGADSWRKSITPFSHNQGFFEVPNSGDEFEELAISVNHMATQIDKQFHTLSTMADIDQLILSTLKIEDIIKIVLNRMHEIISYDYISMTIIDRNDNKSCRTYIQSKQFRGQITTEILKITHSEYQMLLENKKYLIITKQINLPCYLLSLLKLGALSFLVLPIMLKEKVSAIICLGYRTLFTIEEDDILLACDFTNRVAVALSNASWEEQLYYMAHYDTLSGLPNRLLLKDRLQQALARAELKKLLWLFYLSIWIVLNILMILLDIWQAIYCCARWPND